MGRCRAGRAGSGSPAGPCHPQLLCPAGYLGKPVLAGRNAGMGFVVSELGGWAAGTIVGEKAIKVTLEGPKTSEESAVAFLREAVRRAK